jgi:hypothetical protein
VDWEWSLCWGWTGRDCGIVSVDLLVLYADLEVEIVVEVTLSDSD